MDDVVGDHLERVKAAVLTRHTAASIAKWITLNTTIGGQPYSYKDHEFQETILNDTSRDVSVIKCAQVGISEVSVRMALALVNVLRPYTVAYTLPTAHFAGTFAKTRVDIVVDGSKVMKGNIHKSNDNNEVKRFGDSFLYIKGASDSSAPISIPVDHCIHDEVDFCNQEVIGQYLSRLGHSKWQRTSKFSTPTLPKFGIHKAFTESRRHFNFVKCHHCNHFFIPDYYRNVKVPGYFGDLSHISKAILTKIKFQEAKVHCPKCGGVPSLQAEHRQWVCENPSDNYVGAGYQVTPFDAPNVIKVPYLVEISPSFARVQDFVNTKLGLAMEDSEATLTSKDFVNVFDNFEVPTSLTYVMGIDVGNTYHFVVAGVDGYGQMKVVHTEPVPLTKARERYAELRREFRIACTVIDSQPHAETVMALQALDVNLFASVYVKNRSVLTHTVVEKEAQVGKGMDFVRQVNVNRSRAFDGYMEYLRSGNMVIKDSPERQNITEQHMSMKRVKTYSHDSGELEYSWQKSDGNDHYHNAFLYCWIAGKIKGVGKSLVTLPTYQMFSFKNTAL
jgi:ribosomal protein L37AE/L43A